MKFMIVAQTFDAIARVSSRIEMTKMLADLLHTASAQEAEIICNLSLGLLRPVYQGTVFSVAEKTAIKVVASLLEVSVDAVTQKVKLVGDIGAVIVQEVWQPVGYELTLLQVYYDLVALESLGGNGSQDERIIQLVNLLRQLDAISAAYVLRILIGKLRLGFSDMTLIDALSWMISGNKSYSLVLENAYNMCADCGHIAFVLKEHGIEGVKAIKMTVGIPVRPAAAERMPTAQAIIEKLGVCAAQPKLDGFRLQVHLERVNGVMHVRFFSRNLLEMSSMFPDLTQALYALPVENLIAEGEAIAFDEQTGIFVPFQQTVKRKRKHDVEEIAQQLPLKLYFFDILYCNGQSVFEQTHAQRRLLLSQIVPFNPQATLSLIEERIVAHAHDLEEYFEEQMSAGLEGLVVKKINSSYQPGKRNFNWIKLKRQEGKELNDTIDCVILGYYLGKGKRAQFGIGAFLVGLYDEKNDRFVTVAKIGTGMSDFEWSDLKRRCDELAVSEQLHNVWCSKELYPDVWVAPHIVCAVRADDITRSPVHTTGKEGDNPGYALRFPRFIHYRPDKSAQQATSVVELIELFKQRYECA